MERGQFLMVLFKALRLNGVRPYKGLFYDIDCWEWDSAYVQGCIDNLLLDEKTIISKKFRPDDYLTYGEYAGLLIRGITNNADRGNLSDKECYYKAIEKDFINNSPIDSYITREKCYIGLVYLMDYIGNSTSNLPSDTENHPTL